MEALIAVVAATIVAVMLRRLVTAGNARTAHAPEPAPYPIAYLAGGTNRAVMAALASLRVRGAIAGDTSRRMVIAGPLPAGSSQLETAIYELLATRARYMRDLIADQGVQVALRPTRTGLREAGYLIGPRERFVAFLLCGLPLATALGAWYIDLQLTKGPDVAYWDPTESLKAIPATFVALICTVILLATLSRLTPRAKRGLKDLRTRYRNMTPSMSPAWSTYGPVEVAMAVALFGSGILYAEDPVFAAAAGAATYSGSSGGGSSCSSGSSCGGGDSGSSCSSSSCSSSSCGGSSCGGSSCGGGGGCGGS